MDQCWVILFCQVFWHRKFFKLHQLRLLRIFHNIRLFVYLKVWLAGFMPSELHHGIKPFSLREEISTVTNIQHAFSVNAVRVFFSGSVAVQVSKRLTMRVFFLGWMIHRWLVVLKHGLSHICREEKAFFIFTFLITYFRSQIIWLLGSAWTESKHSDCSSAFGNNAKLY